MKHMDKLSKKIIDSYKSGLSSRNIGCLFNISKSKVLYILKKNNISRRKKSVGIVKFNYKKGQKAINPFKKGHIPWNKSKHTGIRPWLGKKRDIITRKKISASHQKININSWKSFITPINKIERAKFKNEIHKNVLERDNYTCQLCGVRGGILHVDHIQSWEEYVELRFDINNCRTLCMACHYKITFGKPMPPEVRAWGHNLFKGE